MFVVRQLPTLIGLIILANLAAAPSNKLSLLQSNTLQTARSIVFVENQGQFPADILWQAHGAGFTAYFGRDYFVFRPFTGSQRISLLKTNPHATLSPLDLQPGKFNFFRGNDPKHWRAGLATYARLRYTNIYPGIDLLFYGHDGKLEYDFVVAPGIDPGMIRLRVDDTQSQITQQGELRTGDGAESVLHRPLLYQNTDRGKRAIEGRFTKLDSGDIGFQFARYDASKTLIIDPSLSLLYSTYLGGPHDDEATAIALDAQSNAYLLGYSASQDYPVSGNAYQTVRKNIGQQITNIVVTKMNPSGILLYSTFLGGSTDDISGGIALDSQGNAYITGFTESSDFPVTANAYQGTFPGAASSAFLAELSPDGSALLYSSFFGGSGGAGPSSAAPGFAIARNPQGNVVISGNAGPGLPTTSNAYQKQISSGTAAFVAVFDLALSGAAQLTASTYYGASTPAANSSGTGNVALAMALDSSGNPWIAGQSFTNNLPTSGSAYQGSIPAINPSCGGATLNSAAYFAKLSADLSALDYASYLTGKTAGAACSEYAHAIVLDGSGNVYVAGTTASSAFPTTTGVFQQTAPPGAGYAEFVSKVSPDGTRLIWSTYLGGNGTYSFQDQVALDSQNNVWVSGTTQGGSNFPLQNAYQAKEMGGYDGHVTQIKSDGTAVLYSTYLGGSGDDVAAALAVDPLDNVYVAGYTTSRDFPVTANAFQPVFANGDPVYDGNDIFLTVLGTGAIGAISPAGGTNVGDATVTIAGSGFQSGAACELTSGSTTIVASAAVVSASGTSITCTFPLSGAATGAYNVVITNPGGAAIQDAGAFTVSGGSASQPARPVLWSGIVVRPAIRTAVPSTLTITYGNSGTVDAYMAVVWIVMSSSLKYSTSGILSANDANCAVLSSLPIAYTLGSSTYIPLLIPILPAGSSYSLPLAITSPADSPSLLFEDYTEPGWFDSLSNTNASLNEGSSLPSSIVQSCELSASDPGISNCFGVVAAALVPGVVSYFSAYGVTDLNANSDVTSELATLLQGILSAEVASGNVGAPYSWMQIADQAGIDLLQGHGITNQCSPGNVTANLASRTILGYGVVGSGSGTGESGMASKAMLRTIVAANLASRAILGRSSGGRRETPGELRSTAQAAPAVAEGATCSNPPPSGCLYCEVAGDADEASGAGDDSGDGSGDSSSCDGSSSGGSVDPNAKTGPVGDGSASAYIRTTSPFSYGVFFENEASATLPAAEVVVTDQLDPTKVDLTTVTLGTISFGGNVINLPGGTANFNTTYSINSSLSVRIQGSLNPGTGLLKWTFTSLDPGTGLPPSDPTVGFLPPDTDGIKGQGSVNFTIKPKSTLTTGAQIPNQATVVFDANPPINTPTWLNTIDVTPPASAVGTLPAVETTPTFPISWAGSDIGSGIAFYNIYVSDNSGPFTAWLTQTTAVAANYSGQPGHTYGFFSIATDGVGNVQAAKSVADATTTVNSNAAGVLPSISPNGVVPISSTSSIIQSGEWASIYGSNLAGGTAYWAGDFPTSLDGTSVTIDGKAAYLSFVSPGQIDIQVPDDTVTGTVPVVVTTAVGSGTSSVTLAPFGPSFFLLDGKHVAGIIPRSDGTYDILGPTGVSLGYPTVAAKVGDVVELYGTGFGPTSPAVPAGQVFSGAAPTTNAVTLSINNVTVTPSFAGLSGAGLYQLNVTIPPGLGTGDVSLQASVGGVLTPTGIVISLQ